MAFVVKEDKAFEQILSRMSSSPPKWSPLSREPIPSNDECSLEDLPDGILAKIASHLPDGFALARMSMQCRRMRSIVGDLSLWKPICLSQWPGCRPELYKEGDWRSLYQSRVKLPPTFVSLLDRIHSMHEQIATVRTCAIPMSDSFEQVMQCLFSVGLLCANDPTKLKHHPEYLALCDDLKCWVRPDNQEDPSAEHMAISTYLHTTREYFNDFDFWTGRFVQWPNVPWRRSAVAYLFDMINSQCKVDFLDLHSNEIQELDAAIGSAAEEADLSILPPKGMMRSHWWFFLVPNYLSPEQQLRRVG